MRGSALEGLSLNNAWTDHAVSFDTAWRTLARRQLSPIAAWTAEHLPEAATTDPLLYMFSGPDFLYAHAFFPNASTYVLCGIEPIGPLPDVTKIPPEALAPALGGLRRALDSVLSFSFFITKQMKTDLQNSRLSGTLPVLYTFLARTGCHVDDVHLVALASDGTLVEGTGLNPGVKITFTSGAHQPQTLFYFCTDLSDSAVGKSGFLKWAQGLGTAHSFAKAASYLMHGENFSKIRQQLLTQSSLIVQDDSGIPVRYFDSKQWIVRPYGRYLGPLSIFKEYPPQPQLVAMYGQGDAQPILFSFGYRWHPSESTLLVAERRLPIPAPVAAPAR